MYKKIYSLDKAEHGFRVCTHHAPAIHTYGYPRFQSHQNRLYIYIMDSNSFNFNGIF